MSGTKELERNYYEEMFYYTPFKTTIHSVPPVAQKHPLEIIRYNQGFGGLGPLEQCKDGKLVYAKEAFERIKHLENKLELAEYDRNYYEEMFYLTHAAKMEQINITESLKKENKRLKFLTRLNFIIIVFNFIGIIALVTHIQGLWQ